MALNHDKGYLSNVERGERSASPELLGGATPSLAQTASWGVWPSAPRATLTRQKTPPSRASGPSGAGRSFQRVQEHCSTSRLKLGSQAPAAADPLLPFFRTQCDQMRNLGQSTAPKVPMPLLETQARMVAALAVGAPTSTRGPALLLASRFAEFTDGMAQEAGDSSAALGWTGEATELAPAGGDPHLGSYALVRHALVPLYSGDAAATIAPAHRAQSSKRRWLLEPPGRRTARPPFGIPRSDGALCSPPDGPHQAPGFLGLPRNQ